ncbi:unnamed protein product [Rhizophagus irregularis]|nr:unnamed protein product [Rhizophagus irregularis]
MFVLICSLVYWFDLPAPSSVALLEQSIGINGIWDGIWDMGLEWDWDLGLEWDYDKWDGINGIWDGIWVGWDMGFSQFHLYGRQV